MIYQGEPLTDERVEQLVNDARRANLVPGSKSLNGDGSHAKALSVRLPDDVRTGIEAIASARGIRPSKLAREVLAEYVRASGTPGHRPAPTER